MNHTTTKIALLGLALTLGACGTGPQPQSQAAPSRPGGDAPGHTTLTSQAVTAAGYKAEGSVTNSWQGGFQGNVRITNISDDAFSSFVVRFRLTGGATVSDLWNATKSGPDASGYYTVTSPDWLQYSPKAAGQSYDVGFTASGSGSVTDVKVLKINGVDLSGVVTPGDTTPPSTPGTPTASKITTTGATLSWTASTDNVGVSKYEVVDGGGKVVTTSLDNSVTLSGLTPNSSYSYGVRALDAAGNRSALSASVTFKTLDNSDAVPPSAPGALSVADLRETSLTLSWGASTDNVAVASYVVTASQGSTPVASKTVTAPGTSVGFDGLTAGTTYSFSVVAVDSSGNKSTATTGSFKTSTPVPDTTAPTAPKVTASATGSDSASLSWSGATDNIGVTRYRLTVGTNAPLLLGNVSSYALSGLTPDTAYSVTVEAGDAAGNWSTPASASFRTDKTGTVATSGNPCARTITGNTDPAQGTASSGAFNYGEALQKAILFYEAQQAGPLPAWNRVNWRGNSMMDNAVLGGWFDAGDHVNFGFPMAGSATMLAWSALEFPQGYKTTGQWKYLENNLRFVTDYFMRAHTAKYELVGQIGSGQQDHAWWGSPEVYPLARPAYKITASAPGSDLAGETAAALAAASLVFRTDDPAYSQQLLAHAKDLYDFADKYRGTYDSAIADASGFYHSWSGYQDELVWGALWLYKATGDVAYLDKAKAEYPKLGNQGQEPVHSYKWTHAWDDKSYGAYVLMAQITGDAGAKTDAERWLDWWTAGANKRVGKLAWLDQWGSLRYAANTAMIADIYAKVASPAKAATYRQFAVDQINFMLGDNPLSRSFEIGFGVNPPKNPHHRGAHGAWANNLTGPPVQSRHTLYGALVGGPGSDGSYTDDRGNYVTNEVATDYNAGFTGALSAMVEQFGGRSSANFPQPEKPDSPEFFVEGTAQGNNAGNSTVKLVAKNQSAWPACGLNSLTMRYFMDLSEVVAAGANVSGVQASVVYAQKPTTLSAVKVWNAAKNIYYVDVNVTGRFAPSSQDDYRAEVQLRVGFPDGTSLPAGAWDPGNDPSYLGLGNSATPTVTNNVSMYSGSTRLSGSEPTK